MRQLCTRQKFAKLSVYFLLQHLPGRAAAGQAGTIGQALVCILGAAASSSNVADPADSSQSAGQDPDQAIQLRTEAGQHFHTGLENPSSTYDSDGQPWPGPGHVFSRFAHERTAGEEARAKPFRELDTYGSSDAVQQEATSTEAKVKTADNVAADGVQSPISLADGLAEADADCAQSQAASGVPGEPDTCILFRPQAVQAKADVTSSRPGKQAPGSRADVVSEQLLVPEKEQETGAQKPDQEHGSIACALGRRSVSKADMSAPHTNTAAGTAFQLFSPMEAVKAISRVESDAHDAAKQAAQPSVTSSSRRSAPQALASSQTGPRQHAQRYSKVHAVGAQQRSQSRASSSVQAGHAEPGNANVNRIAAEADVAHVIPLSSMAPSANAAAELAQQSRHAAALLGKENNLPALSALASAGSIPEKSYQMGGAFSVQNNPLSPMEPSPEVSPPHEWMLNANSCSL